GDAEREYGVMRRVLSRDPQSIAATRGIAAALLKLGKVDDALEAYRRLSSQTGEVQTALVHLLIQRSLSMPEERTDRLQEVDRILAAAAKVDPVPVSVTLLKAKYRMALKEYDAARKLLKDARDKESDKVALPVLGSSTVGLMASPLGQGPFLAASAL